MSLIRIARYDNARDNTPKSQDLTWDQLAELMRDFRRTPCNPCTGRDCPHKDGAAWSPVDIYSIRRNGNVRAITAAVFDLDHLTAEKAAEVFSAVDKSGRRAIIHSTHSHSPENQSYRLIFELSDPVPALSWGIIRAQIILSLNIPADPATKDLSRLYYLPSISTASEPWGVFGEQDGTAFDVPAMLARGALAGLKPERSVDVFERPGAPIVEDQFDLRSRLRRIRKPESKELVDRLLKGHPFAPIGEQDNTLQKLASILAFAADPLTPAETLLDVCRPCFAATDWQDGQAHLEQEFLRKYARALDTRVARDAERDKVNEEIAARFGRPVVGTVVPSPVDAAPGAPVDPPSAGAPGSFGEGVFDQLVYQKGKDGNPTRLLANNASNLKLILAESPEWKGALRWNVISHKVEVHGGPIPVVSMETFPLEVLVWVQRSDYGRQLGLNPTNTGQVAEAILAVAVEHPYDPLRQYLDGLAWDGEPGIDTMLEDYFGVLTTNPTTGDDITEYVRAVSSKFMVGAVARAFSPGCKLDTVLVLEGKQGIKKSTALNVLGGDWFSDLHLDLSNKDSGQVASRFWIVELSELTSLKRAESATQKSFFSRREDSLRMPYGKTIETFPRRCVFAGTTNTDEYLRDPTGERRYWPVYCSKEIDVQGLLAVRDQLWAEAVHRFKAGEEWWLSEVEQGAQMSEAALREEADPLVEVVWKWMTGKPVTARPKQSTMGDVIEGALQMPVREVKPGQKIELGNVLKRLGCKVGRPRDAAGARVRVYEWPEAVLNAPQGSRPSLMAQAALQSVPRPVEVQA